MVWIDLISLTKTPRRDCILFYGISQVHVCLVEGISNRPQEVKRLILDYDLRARVVYLLKIYDQLFSMIHYINICSPCLYDVGDYLMQIHMDYVMHTPVLFGNIIWTFLFRHIFYFFSGSFLWATINKIYLSINDREHRSL